MWRNSAGERALKKRHGQRNARGPAAEDHISWRHVVSRAIRAKFAALVWRRARTGRAAGGGPPPPRPRAARPAGRRRSVRPLFRSHFRHREFFGKIPYDITHVRKEVRGRRRSWGHPKTNTFTFLAARLTGERSRRDLGPCSLLGPQRPRTRRHAMAPRTSAWASPEQQAFDCTPVEAPPRAERAALTWVRPRRRRRRRG